jgi:hypothetical protein
MRNLSTALLEFPHIVKTPLKIGGGLSASEEEHKKGGLWPPSLLSSLQCSFYTVQAAFRVTHLIEKLLFVTLEPSPQLIHSLTSRFLYRIQLSSLPPILRNPLETLIINPQSPSISKSTSLPSFYTPQEDEFPTLPRSPIPDIVLPYSLLPLIPVPTTIPRLPLLPHSDFLVLL